MSSDTAIWLLGTILGIPYIYIMARMVTYAYFKEKRKYHKEVIRQLNEGGCD